MANKNEVSAILKRFADECQDDSFIKDIDTIEKYIKKNEKDSIISFIVSIAAIITSGILLITLNIKSDILFKDENNKIDKKFDSIRNVIIGMNKDINDEVSEKSRLIYKVREDGTIITYKDLDETNDKLTKENDSLYIQLNKLESKLNIAIQELNHIKEVYPIKYIRKNYKRNGNEYIQSEVNSPKIDSALMLLEVYRDKLHYNKEKKAWTIQ